MTEWIRRTLVVACAAIGIAFAWQQWHDDSTPHSTGTWWTVALALVGGLAAATTLVAKRDGVTAAVAMAVVCLTPGFYPLNGAVVVWAIVALVFVVRRRADEMLSRR